MGAKDHGSSTYTSSTMGSDTYGHGFSGFGPGVIHDSKKGPMDTGPSTLGSAAYHPNTRAENDGSSNIHAGPHQSKMANKLDPRVDSDMGKIIIHIFLGHD